MSHESWRTKQDMKRCEKYHRCKNVLIENRIWSKFFVTICFEWEKEDEKLQKKYFKSMTLNWKCWNKRQFCPSLSLLWNTNYSPFKKQSFSIQKAIILHSKSNRFPSEYFSQLFLVSSSFNIIINGFRSVQLTWWPFNYGCKFPWWWPGWSVWGWRGGWKDQSCPKETQCYE